MVTADSIKVAANGLRFRMLRWQPSAARRSLLLLHGLASNARIWELVAPLLAQAGLACFAPDQRGHGQSEKSEDGYDDVALIASDIRGMVEALGLEHPVLVGHSWGASCALAYAANFSQGPGSPDGLVLVDGGLGQLSTYPGATWESMRDLLTPPHLDGVRRDVLEGRLRDPQRKWPLDARALEITLANFELRPDGTVTPHLTFDRHLAIVRGMWLFETYAQFARVRCPILAIPARPPKPWDESERGFMRLKEKGAETAARMGVDIRVHWMDDTVHDVPLHRPEALVEKIVRFVDGL
jgi:pimeloyl-ACP methyl ester carboxylesterase